MCLSKVIKVCEEPLKDVRVGYKVLSKQDRGLYSGLYYNIGPCYEIGKEYTCSNEELIFSSIKELYPSGFHVFENFESAEMYCVYIGEVIIEVEYSNVVCIGEEMFGNVIVAKNIKLIKEIDRWQTQAI